MAFPSYAMYEPSPIDYKDLAPSWLYEREKIDPIKTFTEAHQMMQERQQTEAIRERMQAQDQLAQSFSQAEEQGQPINLLQNEDLFGEVESILAKSGDFGKLIQLHQMRPKPPSQKDTVSLANSLYKMGAVEEAQRILSEGGIDATLKVKPTGGSGKFSPSYYYDKQTGDQVVLPKASSVQEEQERLKALSRTKPKVTDGKDEAEKLLKAIKDTEEALLITQDPRSKALQQNRLEQLITQAEKIGSLQTAPSSNPTPMSPDAPPQGRKYEIRRNPKTGETVKVYLD